MGFLLWEIVEAFPGGEIFPFAYDALDGFGFSHGPASGHQLGVAASGELAVGLAELGTHRHARHLQKIIIAHKFKFAELSELFSDGTTRGPEWLLLEGNHRGCDVVATRSDMVRLGLLILQDIYLCEFLN
jgi:hypothetical protein